MFVLLEYRPKNLTSPTWSHHAIQPQNASHVSLPRPSTNLFLFFCPPVVLHRLVNAYYYFTQHPPLFFDFFSVTVSYTCTSGPNFQVSFVPTQLSSRRVRMPCCYLCLPSERRSSAGEPHVFVLLDRRHRLVRVPTFHLLGNMTIRWAMTYM